MNRSIVFMNMTFVVMLMLSFTQTAFSQVTIGSAYAPLEGALLDLKETKEGTSTKGLHMPISLTQ